MAVTATWAGAVAVINRPLRSGRPAADFRSWFSVGRGVVQAALGLIVIVIFWSRPAGAEDRVSIRGVYFREASTRVVEPMVRVSKELPQGVDAHAHYLLDAVTSASIAAGSGVRTGGQDIAFTEMRHEVGFGAGYTLDHTRLGAQFRYSNEPDYLSRAVGVSLAHGVWENSGTVSFNFARGWDRVMARAIDREMDTWFASLGYTQALSPVLLVQGAYEFSILDGYQANPYLDTRNLGRPQVPEYRRRHVLALRTAYFIPAILTGLQMHYRAYADEGHKYQDQVGADQPQPWGLGGHTVEGRVYKTLLRDFEVRLSYRIHWQGSANFWCNTNPAWGGRIDCYDPRTIVYHSDDPKLGALTTHIPEINVAWNLRWFAKVPLLRVFAAGTAELSYGRLFQSTRFGSAHVAHAGYTMPF